jgi:hypothetical protein
MLPVRESVKPKRLKPNLFQTTYGMPEGIPDTIREFVRSLGSRVDSLKIRVGFWLRVRLSFLEGGHVSGQVGWRRMHYSDSEG